MYLERDFNDKKFPKKVHNSIFKKVGSEYYKKVFSKYDIDKNQQLENIPEWIDNLLHEYQDITGYSDNRINKLCILLNRQINKLRELIGNS